MWFIASVLVILWITAYITFGATAYWVHILLLTAIVLVILNFLQRRRHTPHER